MTQEMMGCSGIS